VDGTHDTLLATAPSNVFKVHRALVLPNRSMVLRVLDGKTSLNTVVVVAGNEITPVGEGTFNGVLDGQAVYTKYVNSEPLARAVGLDGTNDRQLGIGIRDSVQAVTASRVLLNVKTSSEGDEVAWSLDLAGDTKRYEGGRVVGVVGGKAFAWTTGQSKLVMLDDAMNATAFNTPDLVHPWAMASDGRLVTFRMGTGVGVLDTTKAGSNVKTIDALPMLVSLSSGFVAGTGANARFVYTVTLRNGPEVRDDLRSMNLDGTGRVDFEPASSSQLFGVTKSNKVLYLQQEGNGEEMYVLADAEGGDRLVVDEPDFSLHNPRITTSGPIVFEAENLTSRVTSLIAFEEDGTSRKLDFGENANLVDIVE
jgi:hypothetical protein